MFINKALFSTQPVSVVRAEVGTDQADYSPGTTVTISGNNNTDGTPGYAAGNVVDVVVTGPNGWTAACSATAGADGAWSCTITLDSDPAVADRWTDTYTATSTDKDGNPISEDGTFTDGPNATHTCAVTVGGGLKCWGRNTAGQIGDGSATNRYHAREPVSGLTSGVAQVSTGQEHTCVLTTSGGVKCWGLSANGQLGDGTTTSRFTPVDVSGLTSGVAQVSTGGNHTCALLTSGGPQVLGPKCKWPTR